MTTALPAATLLAVLNAAPRGRCPILAPTVIRRDRAGLWWLMSRRETGWSAFGYRYPCLFDLAAEWRLEFVGVGDDAHSPYIEVRPYTPA